MTGEAELVYLEFKSAQSLFAQSVGALDATRRGEVQRTARRQHAIERRVLAAPEARGVSVTDERLAAAMDDLRGRYETTQDYVEDLRANELSEKLLGEGLRRELMVQAVLDGVAADVATPSEVDVELFYRLHRERFLRPERRRASHILVTINDDYAENRRAAALARIRAVGERLAREPWRFAELALACSECPSAAQEGVLGEIPRGQLFPSLDAALFALLPAQVSEVIESPLGFHILRCDAVLPSGIVPFADAAPGIRAVLTGSRARARQRAWLRQLLAPRTPVNAAVAAPARPSEART